MAKKSALIKVNLLPKDPFYETPVGKILKWSLSVGRYIVIFTELIVILSFVSRFNLDRQVTDLNESIFQKQMIIQSFGELEQNVRNTQNKIDQYQQVEQQANIADVFPKLSQITPQDIKLKELTIKPDKVILSGSTQSQAALTLLINNIQLSKDFFNVSVDKIETGDSKNPGFAFQISAVTQETTLKKAPTAPKSNSKTKPSSSEPGLE